MKFLKRDLQVKAYRIRLLVIFALICPLTWLPKQSEAKTGIRDLDNPAITVKAPNRVVLIAITRAGARLVAVGEHGVITYSDDDGKTWAQSNVPVDVTLTAVAFANPSDGWAAGHYGIILHTSDGGVNWQIQLDGLRANQLTLAAAMVAASDHDQSPGAPLAMKRAQKFLAAGPDKPFLTMLVTSPQDAIVFGAYRMAMKTTDGGASWVDWSLHIGDPFSHNIYDVAAVWGDVYIAGEAGSVYRSTDGGTSSPEVTAPSNATMFEIGPTGDGGVFVCGVAGQAFWSKDNGVTWTPVDLNTQANLTALATLPNGTILVGSEAGNLYISRDHARTFSPLDEVEPMEIFGLTVAGNGDVVAVGSGGVIVTSGKVFAQG